MSVQQQLMARRIRLVEEFLERLDLWIDQHESRRDLRDKVRQVRLQRRETRQILRQLRTLNTQLR